ncbi:MAG: ABC transporter permease subunit, partial [Enterobacteriaceae bacterium]|nr:ABC transporter permease subunit [Enterobacteriaceae bacterium]
ATRGKARYARVGGGSARRQNIHAPAMAGHLLAQLLLACVVVLALGTPIAVLGRWLWAGGLAVWQNGDLWLSLHQTVVLASAGALITTGFAIPCAWLAVRHPRRLFRLLESMNYVASSLPGIVTALALVTVTIHYARPIYQTEVTLFLAYMLMFIPRALINLRAGIAQAPVELEHVAQSLGVSPGWALCRVTMRLAAPGAAAAAALVFLGVSNELTATLLLSPLGTRTLATGFWALTSEIDYVAAAPYALCMILISLPLTGLLYKQSQKLSGR